MDLVRAILNYQFGDRLGDKIIEKYRDKISIEFSSNTGRARRIYIDGKLFGTVEPTTGFIIPTFYGGLLIKGLLDYPKYRVVVSDEAVPFVSEGRSVFNKFVVYVYEEILPKDIVLVVDKKDNLLQVGEAILSAKEMMEFKIGIAVRSKHARRNYEENKE